MRRMILLAGLVLAVGVLLPGSARPAAGGTDLPFSFSGATGHSTLNLQTGQLHISFDPGPLMHFGWSTNEQDGYAIPGGPGTFNVFTQWTITAASGDQLFGRCSGTVTTLPDGDHLGLVDCFSTGGTGRLADESATFSVTSLTTHVTVEGGFMHGDVESSGVGLLSNH